MGKAKTERAYPRYGWGWREKRVSPGSRTWVVQRHIKYGIDLYEMSGTEIEVIATVKRKFAEAAVDEPVMSTDTEYGSYGERDRDILVIEGWIDATPDEIAQQERKLDEFAEQRRLREEEEVRRLKKERPELFK